MSITLAQLKTQARDRADMTNSLFIGDDELVNYINSSIAELHDLLIGAYDSDYYMTEYNFSTVANTSNYALPASFYKLRGVDKLDGGEYVSLRPFNFNERNSKYNDNLDQYRYRLIGNNISFYPAPSGVDQIKLWYTPVATKLVLDADVLSDLNQYAEYVIVDAAIKMAQKEESDVSVLMAQKADIRKRIENMASNRDSGSSDAVSDIYAANDDNLFFTKR